MDLQGPKCDRAPPNKFMQSNRPDRSNSATVIIAMVAIATLAPTSAQSGRGAPETGLLTLNVSDEVAHRLDTLDRGELKITWRRDGPALSLGEIRTQADAERTYEKGSAAPAADGCFLVAPFEYTTRNRLGGNTRVSGRARAELIGVESDTADHVLNFSFEQGPAEQQVELSLFDPEPDGDTLFYLDGRQFERFELRLRGTGSGFVSATLVDAFGRRADAGTLPLSPATTGTAKAPGQWRNLRVDTDLEGVHRHHLAQLELRAHGSGTLQIDDVYLCPAQATPGRSRTQRQNTTNSLWVWHTSDLLTAGVDGVDALADLAQQANVGRIYLQVPSSFDEPETQRKLQAVGSRLDTAGIEILALDGAPEYALPRAQEDLLDTVDEVIEYNRSAPPGAGFVGVHLDVEPYLLDQWRDGRAQIVAGYLDMLDAVGARTGRVGLELDVAVPFWFDSVPVHRQNGAHIEWRSLTDEVLARVDSIAVMDYRTETSGSNGLLALGAGELSAAEEQGRDVWIGLETTWLPDQTFVRFRGRARAGLPDSSGQEWWVVQTPHTLWAVRGDALDELGRQLHGVDTDKTRHWPAHGVQVPATRQTFYDLGFDALLDTMQATAAQLAGHPAFAGLALHYDRPLRRLLEGEDG